MSLCESECENSDMVDAGHKLIQGYLRRAKDKEKKKIVRKERSKENHKLCYCGSFVHCAACVCVY